MSDKMHYHYGKRTFVFVKAMQADSAGPESKLESFKPILQIEVEVLKNDEFAIAEV